MGMFEGLFGKPEPHLNVVGKETDEIANSMAIEVAGPVSEITYDILHNIYKVMDKLQIDSGKITFENFLKSSESDYPNECLRIEEKIKELQTFITENIERNESLTVFIEKMEAKNLKADEVVHS